MTAARLAGLAPLLAMALPLVLLFHPVLTSGHVPVAADVLQLSLPWASAERALTLQNWYQADGLYQFYPWHQYTSQMLRQGEVPLWNPYAFSGHPLLANSHSAVLNPFNLLFLVFDFSTAYGLQVVLELYAAGLLTYLYLRRGHGLGRFSALLGGTIYMLNGVFVAWLGWRWMIGGALWIPLVLLCLEGAWDRGRISYGVLGGIPLAGAILGGMIQQSLAIILMLTLYTTIRGVEGYRRSEHVGQALQPFRALAAVCAVGVALAAIQLLPALELMGQSQRDLDLGALLLKWIRGFPRNFPLSVALLATFVNPYWAGNTQSLDLRTLLTWASVHGNMMEYQGYVGILALVLAGIAMRYVPAASAVRFKWLAVLTLALYFATPVSLVLYYRGFVTYTFSVAVLAAFGMQFLLTAPRAGEILARVNRLLIRFLAGFVVLLVAGNIVLLVGADKIRAFGRARLEGQMANYLGLTSDREYIRGRLDALYDNFLVTSPSMWFPVLITVLVVLALALYRRSAVPRPLFKAVCFAIVAAELLYVGVASVPMAAAAEAYPRTDVTEFLAKQGGLFRVLPLRRSLDEAPVMPPNTQMPYGIHGVLGYDSLYPRRYAEFMRLTEEGSLESLDRRLHVVVPATRYRALYDMLNVKYVMVGPDARIDDPRFREVFSGSARVFENREAMPRAFAVSAVRVIEGREAVLAALLSEAFDPRREVILEEAPVGSTFAGGGTATEPEVLTYSPHRVVVRVEVTGDAFLVLADSYFPGWTALVNGVESPVYPANYILRGVRLERGENRVEFVYDPGSFRVGKYVSVSTVVLLAGLLLAGRWRGRAEVHP